jgi:hypothetical protein
MSAPVPLSQIADALADAPGAWGALLVVDGAEADAAAALVEAIEIAQLVGDGGDVAALTVAEALAPGPAPWPAGALLVITGVGALDEAGLKRLDLSRDRLLTAGGGVLLVPDARRGEVLALLPNLRSVIGGRVWSFAESTEPTLDVEAALRALRQRAGFGDEELIRRVEEKAIPLDPYVAEWLVLLNRGDLLDA